MSEVKTLTAPEIKPSRATDTPWEPERQAFWKMHHELLAAYENQAVAIHQGKVIAHGSDRVSVAVEAAKKYGNVPIYVQWVTRHPRAPVTISARLAKKWLG